MYVTVDKFGRLVLPKALRNHFGLQAGSELEVGEQGEKITLKVINSDRSLKLDEGVLIFTGRATGDINEAVTNIRDERLRYMSGEVFS